MVSDRSRTPTTTVLCAALLGYWCFSTPPARAAEASEIDAVVERLVASGRYQTEMPNVDRQVRQIPATPRDPITDIGPIAQFLLILALAAAAIFIAVTLLRKRVAPARKDAAERDGVREVAGEAPAAPTAAELADAEAAALQEAAAGRYDEAVHILLLGAIGRLRERDARSTRRSFTSREILSRAFRQPGQEAARRALRALVFTVETSLFGGRQADDPAFQRCLTAYRALRDALTAALPSGAPRAA